MKPLAKRLAGQFAEIRLKAKVTGVVAHKTGLKVSFEGPDGKADATPATVRLPDWASDV